jgi:hypothetical protein
VRVRTPCLTSSIETSHFKFGHEFWTRAVRDALGSSGFCLPRAIRDSGRRSADARWRAKGRHALCGRQPRDAGSRRDQKRAVPGSDEPRLLRVRESGSLRLFRRWPRLGRRSLPAGRLLFGGSDRAPRAYRRDPLVGIAVVGCPGGSGTKERSSTKAPSALREGCGEVKRRPGGQSLGGSAREVGCSRPARHIRQLVP